MIRSIVLILLLACNIAAKAQVPTTGLLAWYPFNSNTNDSSGNGNDLTAIDIKYVPSRFGDTGQAVFFNGLSSSLYRSRFNLTDSFSYSVWILCERYLTGAVPRSGMILFNGDWTLYNGAGLAYLENGPITPFVYFLTDTSIYCYPVAFKWEHVVLTYSSTNKFRLYMNATLKGSDTGSCGSPYGFFSIGAISYFDSPYKPVYFFEGTLDDIRIYNRELSLSEIDSLYHEGGYVDTSLAVQTLKPGSEINLFPNPTYNTLSISAPFKIASISIFNMLGQTVFSGTYNSQNLNINTTNLQPGMYFININNTCIRKILKE